ncbi:MAG TPA: LemA family protein [Chthoniobacteraceae bacterium]|nr:LemA family protein [Chthoniobacteraceae bacterium]
MKIAVGCIGIIVLFLLIVACSAILSYNGLVNASQAVDGKWANVQADYQRRADLIPNLVQTVQGAANFEKSTIVAVTDARASVGQVKLDTQKAPTDQATLNQYQAAQAQVGSALSRLLVVAENYPDLKSSQNFLGLQAQLEGTENRIAVSRMDFNNAVQTFNTKIRSFPGVLFAGAMGFQPKAYFQSDQGAQNAPKVNFDFSGTTSGSSAPAH